MKDAHVAFLPAALPHNGGTSYHYGSSRPISSCLRSCIVSQYPKIGSTGFNNCSPNKNLGKFSFIKNAVASCINVAV